MYRLALLSLTLLVPEPALAGGDAAPWEAQASAAFAAAGRALRAAAPRRPPPRVTRACPDSGATVTADVPEDAALGCEGAGRAARFMAARGFAAKQPVRILLVDRFPERYARHGVENMHGFYDTDTREVYLKSLRRFLKTPPDAVPLGVAPTRELLVSFVAHEVGHHISIEAYAKAPRLIPRAHGEFISYALQLATMERSAREDLLERFRKEGGAAFAGVEQITLFMHDVDPQRFALKSYLFFATPEGSRALGEMINAAVPSAD